MGGWDWQGIAGINKELDPLILSHAAAELSFSPLLLVIEIFIIVMNQNDDRGHFHAASNAADL